MVHFGDFFENLKLAVKQCCQKGPKLVQNTKIEKFKYDISNYFQTLWPSRKYFVSIAQGKNIMKMRTRCVNMTGMTYFCLIIAETLNTTF